MKRTLKILFGIIAVLIGLGLVMPVVAEWRQEGDIMVADQRTKAASVDCAGQCAAWRMRDD